VPYKHLSDLPPSVTSNLPRHAQEIYKEAFNSAWKQYKDPDERRAGADREETAHKVAWAAVKNVYVKNDKGKWIKERTNE
jgi:cation transport regulator